MFADLNSKFYTLILGALIMLALYHLLIFTKNRKNIYLYYGLYVFALSVYLVERLPDDPLNIHYINPSVQFLIFALYVQFARNLLETKGKNIVVDRYFKVFYKYLYGLSMACLILYFISYDFLLKIYFYIIPFFILLCVFVYWQIFKIEGAVVKYFIIGSLFYFLLTVTSFVFTPTTGLIQESWIFKKGFHPLFFMYVGVMIESIVFAILVGQKAKNIEVENAIFQKNIVI